MGMECEIFMGKEDTERQALNVYRMRLLGAKVNAVTSGTATLKDAVSRDNERVDKPYFRYTLCTWFCNGTSSVSYNCSRFSGSDLQRIKEQILEKEGRLPDAVLACVGGGSNAIGTFYNFDQ